MNHIIPITTQCACLDDEGNAWIFTEDFNGLFFLDTSSYKMKFVTTFEKEEILCSTLYNETIWYHNKIFCFPVYAKSIAVYDVQFKRVRYIYLQGRRDIEYYNVVQFSSKKVLLFPILFGKTAYIFDLEKETYEHIELDYGKNEEYLQDKILRGLAFCNEKAYFAIGQTNRFLVYDTNVHSIEVQVLSKSENIFSAVSDGKFIYVLLENGCECDIYDMEGYRSSYGLHEREYNDNTCKIEDMKYIFNAILGDNLIASIPMKNSPLCLLQDGILRKVELDWNKIAGYKSDIQPFAVCKKINSQLLLFPYHAKTLVSVKLDTMETAYVNLGLSVSEYVDIYGKEIKKKMSSQKVIEEKSVPLNVFFDEISEEKSNNEVFNKKEVGSYIFKKMKQEYL